MTDPDSKVTDLVAALEASIEKAREARRAQADDERQPFYFTVPQKFLREEHPLGLGPDDLFVVRHHTEIEARLAVISALGKDTWCSVHTEAQIQELAYYYPGRRVDFPSVCDLDDSPSAA